MALFKKEETAACTPNPVQHLQESVDVLAEEVGEFKKSVQKQIDEICSALNILDEDVLELRAAKRNAPASVKGLDDLKKSLESLKVLGRLCLQNKEDLDALAKKMEPKSRPDARPSGPSKILN